MLLPVVLEMEQEPSPTVTEQDIPPSALEQMSLPTCNGFELLSAASEQMPSPIGDDSKPPPLALE